MAAELERSQGNAFLSFSARLDVWLARIEKPVQVIGMLAATFLIVYQTIFRYIIAKLGMTGDTAACEELALFCYIWCAYFALPWATRQRENIRITVLFDRFPERGRDILWAFSECAFLGFAIFMVYLTGELVYSNIIYPKYTAGLDIPYAIPYCILPIGFVITSIRLLQNMGEQICKVGLKSSLIGAALFIVFTGVLFLDLDLGTMTILLIALAVFMLLGVPIAISLGLSTIISIIASDSVPVGTVAQISFVALDNVPLLGVFFFITAGMLMGAGGLSRQLIHVAEAMVGHIHGGIALAAVVGCMFFAAISGSGPATVAAIGAIAVPAMVDRGYDKGFAAALVACAGSIGILIPPSNPFVMYGVLAQVSIGKLFMAGIVPGLLLGGMLMVYSYVLAKRKGWKGNLDGFSMKRLIEACWEAKWALMIPVIILGGIYCGIMTPTESAAVATAYGLFVGVFVYRQITFKNIVQVLCDCCSTASIILILVAIASIFSYILALEQVPNQIAEYLSSITESRNVFLLLMIGLLLIVGMFMEPASATIILTPILVPVLHRMGIDPLHFGVILVFGTAVGFVTPPVGNNLFVASAICDLKVETIAKAALGMLLGMMILFFLVTYIPAISLFPTWSM